MSQKMFFYSILIGEKSWSEFDAEVKRLLRQSGHTLIEVPPGRLRNATFFEKDNAEWIVILSEGGGYGPMIVLDKFIDRVVYVHKGRTPSDFWIKLHGVTLIDASGTDADTVVRRINRLVRRPR